LVLSLIYLITLFIAPQLWIKPFIGIRVDLYIYPIWFFYLIFSGNLKGIRFGPQEIFLILWVFWVMLSLAINGVFVERWETISFFYIKWLILYFFISHTLKTINDTRLFFITIVILAIILCIEGIYHYQTGIGWPASPWMDRWTWKRKDSMDQYI
jgi:hypothetical protein